MKHHPYVPVVEEVIVHEKIIFDDWVYPYKTEDYFKRDKLYLTNWAWRIRDLKERFDNFKIRWTRYNIDEMEPSAFKILEF